MSTIAEVKTAAADLRAKYLGPFTEPFHRMLRLVEALPDSEVPPGKVLVDEADLLEAVNHRGCGPACDALDRMASALPAPEWEPSDELVERWCEALRHCHIAKPADRAVERGDLKTLHAAGLLNLEVTG